MELLHSDPDPHPQCHKDGTQDREQYDQCKSLRLHRVVGDHVGSVSCRRVDEASRIVTAAVNTGARRANK